MQPTKTSKIILAALTMSGALVMGLIAPSALAATPTTTAKATQVKQYKVVKVVDGDTLDVSINGKTEAIRLIGINTPETVDPRKPVECFGKEASNKAKELLAGKTVGLQNDPTQGERDKYGRLLRYVTLADGTSFNKLMISQGYAYEYTYNKPYKYQAEYKQAQKTASANKKGLWADTTCKGVATPVTTKETVKSGTTTTSDAQPAVKKSVNNLCHAKGSKYYVQTKKFTPYASLKDCLASGGKTPSN